MRKKGLSFFKEALQLDGLGIGIFGDDAAISVVQPDINGDEGWGLEANAGDNEMKEERDDNDDDDNDEKDDKKAPEQAPPEKAHSANGGISAPIRKNTRRRRRRRHKIDDSESDDIDTEPESDASFETEAQRKKRERRERRFARINEDFDERNLGLRNGKPFRLASRRKKKPTPGGRNRGKQEVD